MPTAPLDESSLLMQQLARIEDAIKALPVVIARIDMLNDSTCKLERAFQEAIRELRQQDAEQKQAIESIRLHLSELMVDLDGLSSTFQEMRLEVPKISRRLDNLVDSHNLLNLRVTNIERGDDVGKVEQRLEMLNADFMEWKPWWRATKWALAILGGCLLAALFSFFWTLLRGG